MLRRHSLSVAFVLLLPCALLTGTLLRGQVAQREQSTKTANLLLKINCVNPSS